MRLFTPARSGLRQRPRRPARALLAAAVLLPSLLLTACLDGEPTDTEGLTAGEFVEVVARIREAERALGAMEDGDSAAVLFAARKAEILAEHEVTEEELYAYLDGLERDPEALRSVWDSLTQRLKHVPGGSDEPGSGPPRRGPDRTMR